MEKVWPGEILAYKPFGLRIQNEKNMNTYNLVYFRSSAKNAYEQCLQLDVYRVEALERLIQHNLATELELQDLVKRLPIDQQCSDTNERILLRHIYQSMVSKTASSETKLDEESDNGVSSNSDLIKRLKNNLSMMTLEAEKLYKDDEY